MKSSEKKYYGLLSAIITMVVLLLAMSYGQMIGGKYAFINADLYEQCAPFTQLYINKILEGSNLYYSFKTGLGMNTSLVFSFGVLSPINVLYLLSDGSNINVIAIAVFVIKAGVAAFSFQLYAKYNLRVENFVSVLFSMGYALASYGIGIVYSPSLYDGIYLLPLVLVAIKYFVDNNKILWLTLLYSVLFITNFYSGYIVGISSFVYFLLYILYGKKSEIKAGKVLFNYFVGVICAFLLSCFVIVPTVYDVLEQNAFDSEYNFSALPIWVIISDFFPFFNFEMYAKTPYFYCGMPALFLAAAFFINTNIQKRYKVMAGLTLLLVRVSTIFLSLYSVAHMFNDPTGYTYRYAFIVALVISSMGLHAFRNIDGISIRKLLIVVGGLTTIHCMSSFMNKVFGLHDNSPSILLYLITIFLAVVWVSLLNIYIKVTRANDTNKAKVRDIAIIALVLMAFEVGANSYILLTSQPQEEKDRYDYRVGQAKILVDELGKIDKSSYRVHYDGLMNMNQACLYDYYGSTLYATSNNQRLKDFLYDMGISSTDFFILGKGSTDLTKLLLNEKYDLGAYIYYNEGNENYILENPTVGFGFMVNEDAINVDLDGDVFENQNKVYSVLLGEEVSPFECYDGEMFFDGENVNIEIEENRKIRFSLGEDSTIGCLRVGIPIDSEKMMYGWMSSGYNTIHAMSPVIFTPDAIEECEYVKPLLTAPHILKMSVEDNMYTIYVYLSSNTINEARIEEYRFAYYDDIYIYELWEKLNTQSFRVKAFEDGYVEGDINVVEEGICYMSIPYEDGWLAIVDGKIVDITPVLNETFIGIPLDAGYHEIELRFVAPGSRLGCALSIIGFFILGIIVVGERRRFWVA